MRLILGSNHLVPDPQQTSQGIGLCTSELEPAASHICVVCKDTRRSEHKYEQMGLCLAKSAQEQATRVSV